MRLDEAMALAELASDPELSAKVMARSTTSQAWEVARTLLSELKRIQRLTGVPIAEPTDTTVEQITTRGGVPFMTFAGSKSEAVRDAFAWWLFQQRIDYEVDRSRKDWVELYRRFREGKKGSW